MPTYTFSSPSPAKLYVELGNGRLDVTATETDETVVTVEGDQADDVTVEQDGDEIRVIAPKTAFKLLGFGSRGPQVTVSLPTDSQLRTKTGSADVTAGGRLRAAWAQTGSGDITLDEVTGPVTLAGGSAGMRIATAGGPLQAKSGSGDLVVGTARDEVSFSTGSGDVRIQTAQGRVVAKTGSGDVEIGEASADVTVTTGSGDVRITCQRRGTVSTKGGSGDIKIGIPAGTPVWTDLSTGTGTIRSTVASAGRPAEGQDYVELRGRRGSGDIILEQL